MPKYPGRIVSATPPSVSLSGASGVWTLEEVAQYEQAGTWPVGVAVADPYFNQTVLLLHGDGTNGAQNNTFLDSSTNNFTITRNGNTTQGTFSPFSGPDGYWSNFFDGTNDRLTIADNAALRPGTDNFTIEAWVYRAAAGAAHTIFAKGASTPTGFAFSITSSDTLRFTDTSTDIDSTGTVAANAWVHVAVVREGTGSNQLKLYINGVQDGQGTVSTDFNQTEEARIGENRGATDDFNGYISNFRYVVGSAIYTAGFALSTVPLTTTSQGAVSSEVELLTCQSNRFVDNSTNGFTVTPVNNARVTPFSPFAPSAAYSAGTNGGSGDFDGTGGYLTVPDNAAFDFSSAFTIECWLYCTANNNAALLDTRLTAPSSFGYVVSARSDGTIELDRVGSNVLNGTIVRPLNAWSHVVIVRDASDNLSLFINGVRDVTTTNSNNFDSDNTVHIGAKSLSSSTLVPITGYISNFRIVKGTAVYDPTDTTITIPTAPLTAITNTSLLCNFTNAGIFDNTGKNNLETVGDAQIDTTTKKFGTGSMEFDGTGDRLFYPNNPINVLGTGDYTIEFWVYANSWTSTPVLLEYGRPAATGTPGLEFYISNSSGKLDIYGGAATATLLISAGSNISATTWTHVALTRQSGSTKLFLDGVQTGSTATDTTNYTQATVTIGAFVTGTLTLNGFIDDLRITKGVARYPTEPFPTAPFPDL